MEEKIGIESNTATVTKMGLLSMQVCVPKGWTDEQAVAFAEREYPCGTTNGWFVRKQGDRRLAGANERVQCKGLATHIHIMLDALPPTHRRKNNVPRLHLPKSST